MHDRGWKLGILSNTDPEPLAAALRQIGAPVDLVITAAELTDLSRLPQTLDTLLPADANGDRL